MKKAILRKLLGIVLTGVTVGSVAAVGVPMVGAAVTGSGIKGESVGICGTFTRWGIPDEDGRVIPDIPMTDDDGDGVWEGIIDVPSLTEEMIVDATADDGTGNRISRGFQGVAFKVRLNNEWNECWGDYEPLYNRTWNSLTDCAVEAAVGQSLKIRVRLDTTTIVDQSDVEPGDRYEMGGGNEWVVWPLSYEILEQSDPLVNTSILSHANPMYCGQSIKVTPRAKGGAGDYSFAVYYKKTGTVAWTCAKAYETVARNVTVTPNFAGTCLVRVKAKDADGTVVDKDYRIPVESALKNNSTLRYRAMDDDPNAAVFGTKVTVNCSSADAAGTVKYEVYYKQTQKTKWTRAQKYSTNAVVSFKPKAATDYQVCVRAKDSYGKVVKQNLTFTVKKAPDLINRTGISYQKPLVPGKEIVLNCASVNAIGECRYAVYYKPVSSTKWTTAQKFSTNTVVRFTPKKVTDYTVSVKAKDERGQVKKLTYSFTVTTLPLTNTSYAPSYSPVNKPLLIHCGAEGGKGDYKFAVYYKQASKSTYTTLQTYQYSEGAVFTPKTTNMYDVRVKVKDAAGKVVTKDMKVKVYGSSEKVPPFDNFYEVKFSPEMESYLATLPEDAQQYFNILKNTSIRLKDNGEMITTVPNNDGTFQTGYGSWHDNFDGTVTFSNANEDSVMSYTVSNVGVITFYDPEQPAITLQSKVY